MSDNHNPEYATSIPAVMSERRESPARALDELTPTVLPKG